MKSRMIKSTPFGSIGIIWKDDRRSPRIVRILLTLPQASAVDRLAGLYPQAETGSCAEVDVLAEDIQAMLEGETVSLSLDLLDWDPCGTFQRRVLLADYNIPRGRVSTYGRIAAYLGSEKGGRAVGTALARNPFPLVIPCHRVVRADGQLGGYQGGLEMKRTLLAHEGVVTCERGRVEHSRFYY